MKLQRVSSITLMLMFVPVSALAAPDFDWTRNLSIEAKADPSGLKHYLKLGSKL